MPISTPMLIKSCKTPQVSGMKTIETGGPGGEASARQPPNSSYSCLARPVLRAVPELQSGLGFYLISSYHCPWQPKAVSAVLLTQRASLRAVDFRVYPRSPPYGDLLNLHMAGVDCATNKDLSVL